MSPGLIDERLHGNRALGYQWLFMDLLFGAEVGGIFIISLATLSFSEEPGCRLKVASQLSGFPSYLTLNIGPVNCPSIPFSSSTG